MRRRSRSRPSPSTPPRRSCGGCGPTPARRPSPTPSAGAPATHCFSRRSPGPGSRAASSGERSKRAGTGCPPEARAGLDVLAVASRPLPRAAVTGSDELIRAGLAASTGDRVEIRHALLGGVHPGRPRRDGAARGTCSGGEPRRGLGRTGPSSPRRRAPQRGGAGRPGGASRNHGTCGPGRRSRSCSPKQPATLRTCWRPRGAWPRSRRYEELLAVLRDMPEDGPGTVTEASVLRARAMYRTGRVDDAWSMVQELTGRHAARRDTGIRRCSRRRPSRCSSTCAATRPALSRSSSRRPPGTRRAVEPGWVSSACARPSGSTSASARISSSWSSGVEQAIQQRLPEAVGSGPEPVQSASGVPWGTSGARRASSRTSIGWTGSGWTRRPMTSRTEAAQAAVYAGDFRVAVALADFVLERPASHRARLQAAVRRAEALIYLGDFELARASLDLASGGQARVTEPTRASAS